MNTLDKIISIIGALILSLIILSCEESKIEQLNSRLNTIIETDFISDSKHISSLFLRSNDYYIFRKDTFLIVKSRGDASCEAHVHITQNEDLERFVSTMNNNNVHKFLRNDDNEPILIYYTIIQNEKFILIYDKKRLLRRNYKILFEKGDWYVSKSSQ
jgi:hypothetical protein